MADPAATPRKFEMVSIRAALLDGPPVASIEQQIQALEEALARVPDFAFDLSKTLIETVCKTLLADLGQIVDPGWDCPKLFREVTNRLALLPPNHPNANAARESIQKTMNGLLQTVHGLCELRKSFGLASHGRDAFAARLGTRQAALAAQAADTIAAFVYLMHRDAVGRTPGERVYYEDHKEFNEAFDQNNDPVRIGDLQLLASRVLFLADREAYKAELLGYIADQNAAAESPEGNGNAEPEVKP